MSNPYADQPIYSKDLTSLMRRINALEAADPYSYRPFTANSMGFDPQNNIYFADMNQTYANYKLFHGDDYATTLTTGRLYSNIAVGTDGWYACSQSSVYKFKFDGTRDIMWGWNGEGDMSTLDELLPEYLFLYPDGCLGLVTETAYAYGYSTFGSYVYVLSPSYQYKWSLDGKVCTKIGAMPDSRLHISNNGTWYWLYKEIKEWHPNGGWYPPLEKYWGEFSGPSGNGKLYAVGSEVGNEDGFLLHPGMIASDSDRKIYITDGNKIKKFTETGVFVSEWNFLPEGNSDYRITSFGAGKDGKIYIALYPLSPNLFSWSVGVLKVFSSDGELVCSKYLMTRSFIGQTTFYGFLSDFTYRSLGIPDGGLSVPVDDALFNVNASLDLRHILMLRSAILLFLALGRWPLYYEGTRLAQTNICSVAMGDRTKYGATGGARSTWTRTEAQMIGTSLTDIDIGEIYECVRVLESATRA